MSVQILQACCCDCTWRQAFECYTDTATGYYKLASSVDVTKTYGIDDGADRLCVYFANCYGSNPGSEAANLTEYDDCEECGTNEPDWPNPEDEPAPCDCVDAGHPLPDAYTLNGHLWIYTNGTWATPVSDEAFEVVLTGEGDTCGAWTGTVNIGGVDTEFSLELDPLADPACAWSLGDIGSGLNYQGLKFTRLNPTGAYPDTPGPGGVFDQPYKFTDMVIS
jgi:hypothetical protein